MKDYSVADKKEGITVNGYSNEAQTIYYIGMSP